jgi:hypothetical protein
MTYAVVSIPTPFRLALLTYKYITPYQTAMPPTQLQAQVSVPAPLAISGLAVSIC